MNTWGRRRDIHDTRHTNPTRQTAVSKPSVGRLIGRSRPSDGRTEKTAGRIHRSVNARHLKGLGLSLKAGFVIEMST